MKRNFNSIQNSNTNHAKGNITLEGIVVSITNIYDAHTDKNGKYWSALICDARHNVHTLNKYFSVKTQ
jgi:hypothetical protein